MAGVSLALRRMLGSRSYLSQTMGYAYAGLAMAGPWILTALYMRVIDAVPLAGITAADRTDFQAIVLYAYCGSTLIMGLVQFGAARYVSDRIYVKDIEPLVPTYAATSLASLLLHAAAAALFMRLTRPDPLLAAAEMAFFGSLALVWCGMIFLGAIRSFVLITVTFAGGMAVSFLASYYMSRSFGLPGLLGGFSLGQGLIAAVFGARLRAEFPQERPFDFGFFRTLAKYPSLLMIGLAYSGGLWIDKMILWAGPFTLRSHAGLSSLPLYDNAVFLAYLTLIPALAMIFIRIEVSFYEKCRRFYGAVREGADLATIRACRRDILDSFRLSMRRIINLQGPITLLIILFAPLLLGWLRIDWVQYYMFRIACLGAFLQVLVLTVLLTQLHLALYRQALTLAVTYLVVNGGVTAAAVQAGLPWYGYGYVAAGVVTLALSYPLLWRKLRYLERDTFMNQPIGN